MGAIALGAIVVGCNCLSTTHVTLDLSHRLTKMKFEIFLCVRQLVHLFVEKCKSGIICSVFKIFLPNLVHMLPWTYLTDWPKSPIFQL